MRRAREELAATAVRLFASRGFNETTVEDIADESDYSASTFFRHFAAKEDAAFHDVLERIADYESLLQAPRSEDIWPLVRELMLTNAAEWEERNPDFSRARTALYYAEPVLYRRYLEYCHDIERLLAKALAAHRGTTPQSDVWCAIGAAAAMGAWRAGVTAWLAREGDLRDCVAAGLDVVEPAVRANIEPPKSPAARRDGAPRADRRDQPAG